MIKIAEQIFAAFGALGWIELFGAFVVMQAVLVSYLPLYGKEPSAIEQAYAIFANVLEFDESGQVLNAQHAQQRATDNLRAYCVRDFKVEPPYEDWELELHEPPTLNDLK